MGETGTNERPSRALQITVTERMAVCPNSRVGDVASTDGLFGSLEVAEQSVNAFKMRQNAHGCVARARDYRQGCHRPRPMT